MLADDLLSETVDDNQLKAAERAFRKELFSGKPSADTTFLFAYFLVRSKKSDIRLGLSLLSDLLSSNGSSKDDKFDYLFYTANFDFALNILDAMLQNDGYHEGAKALKEAIEKRILKQSYVNKGVIFSIVAGIVTTLAIVLLRLR